MTFAARFRIATCSASSPLRESRRASSQSVVISSKSPAIDLPSRRASLSSVLKLAPINERDLPEIRLLMTKYQDHPMDFADATLVHLAARESVSLILTVDHDDFETYRIGGRKRFSILPSRWAKLR
jgi:predicted nucleic acid-binding protein